MVRLVISMIMLLSYLPLIGQSDQGKIVRPFLMGQTFDEDKATINNIESLNSDFHDYCPIILDDGILFTSDRTERGDADFYYAAYNPEGKILPPLPFEEILSSDFQEGMAALSPDRKTMIFSRDISGTKETNGFSDVRLYIAEKVNGLWTAPRKMSINVTDFSSGHPSFSPDGNRLYFVSNRPGSYGGTDIYVSTKKKSGKWSKPKNLGIKVNSPRNELFVSTDKNENLYFSSNRSEGIGLLDIYSVKKMGDNLWSRPVNIGAPINSKSNDFGVFVKDDAFYFSSDRKGGKGGNDIYYYGVPKNDESSLMVLNVEVKDINSGEYISNAKVSMMKNGTVQDWTATDENGIATLNFKSSQRGSILVSHSKYPERRVELSADELLASMEVLLEKVSCISMTGQITNQLGQELMLANVPIRVLNLSTSVEDELVANADGSFELCLPCNTDFRIKAFAEKYYCEDLSVTTKNLECSNGEYLQVQVPVSEIDRSEKEGLSENMTAIKTQDSIAQKNEENKTFLESISIAQEEDVIPDTYEMKAEERIEAEPEIVEETEKNDEAKSTSSEMSSFEFSNIYFDFDSYKLDQSDQVRLDNLATYLKSNPTLKIELQTFSDARGSKSYNKKLAKRRAESIMEYMLEVGVEWSRIIAKPKGELSSETNYAEARRAELMITKSDSEIDSAESSTTETYVSEIYYEFDAFRLNKVSSSEVEKVYAKLKADPSLKVEVRSHTDSRGSSEYNRWLSQKRANEVVRQIIRKGIDPSRLDAKGFGESDLVNDCGDESDCSKAEHAKNRRTEFVFE